MNNGRVDVPRIGYRIDELAMLTGVSRATIYLQMKNGRLKWVQVGDLRIVTPKQAEAWLASLTTSA